MNKETEHLYNLVTHLILSLAHISDNQQRIMQGETPSYGKDDFHQLIESMQQKLIDINNQQ